jgi:dihydroorotate dehydrogenase
MSLYTQVLRPLLFQTTDPEKLHRAVIAGCSTLGKFSALHPLLDAYFTVDDSRLCQTLWGLTFPAPLGLAAGFDKNADGVNIWSHLGFGFAEIGSVTCHGQPGNPQPRLFRLPEDEAIINRMGFNNDGADVVAQKLARQKSTLPLGINLGKSKITPLEEAPEDYRYSFSTLYSFGDYFVVNVSSPNTPGLRELQNVSRLEEIFKALQAVNSAQKPLLVKIAPDLADPDIDAVVDLAQSYALAGVIATNTTIGRTGLKSDYAQSLEGGLSGAPVRKRSTEVIQRIYRRTGGKLPIIGVGGIFHPQDAWEKLAAGASLLQTYTGWVYEGPRLPYYIHRGLLNLMEQQGLKHLSEIVGRDV